MVLEIDEARRRISLGIKQCMPNPWGEFGQNHDVGSTVKGAIRSITDFGVFVGLFSSAITEAFQKHQSDSSS